MGGFNSSPQETEELTVTNDANLAGDATLGSNCGDTVTVKGKLTASCGLELSPDSHLNVSSSGIIIDTLHGGNVYISGSLEVGGSKVTGGGGSGMTSFQLEDGDGTEVTIADAKEVKFIESNQNIQINWTDVTPGSDADPYDLTFSIGAVGFSVTGTLYALSDLQVSDELQVLKGASVTGTLYALEDLQVSDELRCLKGATISGSACLVGDNNVVEANSLLITGTVWRNEISIGNSIAAFTEGYGTTGDYCGEVIKLSATTSLTTSKIYYMATNGTWTLAQADNASDGGPGILLGVAVGASSHANGMLTRGIMRIDNSVGAMTGTPTAGSPLFLCETTAGNFNIAAPGSSSEVVRVVGHVLKVDGSSNILIHFNPSNDWIVRA